MSNVKNTLHESGALLEEETTILTDAEALAAAVARLYQMVLAIESKLPSEGYTK